MTDYFAKMFAYNAAVNQQMLDWLQEASGPEDKAHAIFAHLLAAERVWLLRLLGRDSSVQAVWPDLSLEDCSALIEENRDAYARYLDAAQLDSVKTVSYKNSRGNAFEMSAQDILSHVLLHSSYHRGQVTLLLRGAGAEPLNTDYLQYVRSS